MRRAGATALLVLALIGTAAWWAFRGGVGRSVDLAASAPMPEASAPRSANLAPSVDPWATANRATRVADQHADPRGEAFCGAPFMDDERPEVADANQARLDRHWQAVVDAHVRRLANAPDELGRMSSALLAQDADRAVEVAMATTDPLVYGLGLRACRRSATAQCRNLSAERWVQLDPTNLAAWWLLAAAAPSQSQAFQILKQAGAATHVLSLRGQVLKRTMQEGQTDPVTLAPIAMHAIGMDSADPSPFFAASTKACGAARRDVSLRQDCQNFARQAVQLEPFAIDRLLALSRARSHGVAAAELPHSEKDMHRLMSRIDEWRLLGNPADARLDCGRVTRMTSFDAQAAGIGDLALWQRLQSRSAPPSSALASMPQGPQP